MKLERTAAYVRVSTQEQKLHGLSLDAQRQKLTEYAEKNNLTIVGWYEDEGVSGRKLIKNRPELQRMIHDAEKGLFSRIIFIKLDRFFRSVAEYHECMKIIDPVIWTATEEKYDLSTAGGRAFVNMKLVIAEMEADQTGERIKLVNDYKVKTGQPVTGSLCWSHTIINTENGKRVVVNPETREQALSVIDYYLKTNSLRKTLRYCDQFHSFYDIQGLKRWFQSTLLIGKYKDNNEYCEPLIDIDTYNLLQEKLSNNIRYSPVGEPLFRKLIICPHCGRRLTAITSTSSYNSKNGKVKYRYEKYRCDARLQGRCDYKLTLSENMVEKTLLDNLPKLLNDHIVNSIDIKSENRVVDTSGMVAELERVNYMFEKGRITPEEYDERYEELQAKIEGARSNETESVDPRQIEYYKEFVNSGWRAAYDDLTMENKANFWHRLLKEIHIEKQGREYSIKKLVFY